MNHLILSLMVASLSLPLAHAQTSTKKFTVLVRHEKSNKILQKEAVLEDLISQDSFNGKYFVIVKGKDKEAIPFNHADKDLVKKAANVYYHLTHSRKFWLEKINPNAVTDLKKIVIRLELQNLFDDQGHYANDNRDPQVNNALSIPEGETPAWLPAHKQEKWGKEIWFRPMKKVDVSHLISQLGPGPVNQALSSVEKPFMNFAENNFRQTVAEHVFYPTYAENTLTRDVLYFAGTIALTKIILEGSKQLDKFFLNKTYYLETAMVPEVIAHEYAHVVLSDYLRMTHSTPVVEGMADYFATVQSNKRKMYAEVKGHSNSNPKDRDNKAQYNHWKESNHNAAGDFVLGVLWDVRESLGASVGDKVVYESRKFLKTDSNINENLLRAVLNSCDEVCENPRRDKFKLYQKLSDRGF